MKNRKTIALIFSVTCLTLCYYIVRVLFFEVERVRADTSEFIDLKAVHPQSIGSPPQLGTVYTKEATAARSDVDSEAWEVDTPDVEVAHSDADSGPLDTPETEEALPSSLAIHCDLRKRWSGELAQNCISSLSTVHFVVKSLAWGSAQQRGIQPAFALRCLSTIKTSVIDCRYYCKTRAKRAKLNERISRNAVKGKTEVFIHMDAPCRCVLHASRFAKAIHILEFMDTLDFTPAGFDQYIVATESTKRAVIRKLASNGMHVPVKVVPSHDSNLLGRGSEMRASLEQPVSNVLYMGSKPLPEMVSSVRNLLTRKHEGIAFLMSGDESLGPITPSGLNSEYMKERATVEEMWPHSVAYSDSFAVQTSLPGAVAIVWDQCSEYTARCSWKFPFVRTVLSSFWPFVESENLCKQRQQEICLQWKDDGRLTNHLSIGVPTLVYDKYGSHRDLLQGSSYPLAASTLDGFVANLDEVIRNSTVRTLSSSVGMSVTSNRTLCSTARAYFEAICAAVG